MRSWVMSVGLGYALIFRSFTLPFVHAVGWVSDRKDPGHK